MKVICFGDSNTYGYNPDRLRGVRYKADVRWTGQLAQALALAQTLAQAQALTQIRVINEGENGREIPQGAEMIRAVQRLADLAEDGDVITVMLGGNDILLGGATAAETAKKMETFLQALTAGAPGAEILLIGPVNMKEGMWVDSPDIVRESEKLPGLYEALGRLPELSKIRFTDANLWGVGLSYDGVHFTEDGHRAFAKGLTEALKLCYSIG